jgi:glycosyltransferase involved in cell wall biosynthesis
MPITQIMVAKEFGGAERSFVDTATALAERGHQVQAICHPQFPNVSLLEGRANIQLEPIHVGGSWDWRAVRQITRAIKTFGSDIVHAHMARAALLGGKAARRAGIPCVAKLHNYAKLGYYRHVDHFVATTPDQANYLLRHRIADERISVIPNFSRIKPVDSIPRRPCDEIVFVTCGRLVVEKAIDTLITAFAKVRRCALNARLIIGGDGPLKQDLMHLARTLGVENRIEWAGWVSDVEAFVSRGDVFVLSSRSESFGIVLLEAMARGVPIIATRTKGPPQVIGEDAAWFVEPDDPGALADAMQSAANNSLERHKKASAALQLYRERYFESAVVPRLEKLYEQMIRSRTLITLRPWRISLRRAA